MNRRTAAPVITTDIAAAAAALAAGRLVAFATETVYGLGAAAAQPAAVAELYRVKQRPSTHPVIVHIADFAAASEWASDIPPPAQQLARHFMPGPLTLLLPRQPHITHLPGDLIALRIPAHPLAHTLLQKVGSGVVAPSANRFGALSPTCAQHVADEFADADLLILDGGDCPVGIESTIVGFSGETAYIARPGQLGRAALAATGIRIIDPPAAVSAPGTLARHYAPRTPLHLIDENEMNAMIASQPRQKIGVLSPQRPAGAIVWRQAATAAAQYARALYRHLRSLDDADTTLILVSRPPGGEEWEGIHDRLKRASTRDTDSPPQ